MSAGPVLYEMRSYRVADGRMTDELARGLACILAPAEGGRGLFDRYGIPRPVGLWRVLSGARLPAVIFLYRWTSVAERAHAFETFYDDAEWNALRAGSNEGSEIVNNMDDIRESADAAYALTPATSAIAGLGAPRRMTFGPGDAIALRVSTTTFAARCTSS